MNRSRNFGILRSKWSKIRHFGYEAIFSYLHIFAHFWMRLPIIYYYYNTYNSSSYSTFQIFIGLLPVLTVVEQKSFKVAWKVLTQQKSAYLWHLECLYLVNSKWWQWTYPYLNEDLLYEELNTLTLYLPMLPYGNINTVLPLWRHSSVTVANFDMSTWDLFVEEKISYILVQIRSL